MKIKSINIDNFKSLVDFKLVEPNPFSVFVGPNGSGKSNVFEAIEFSNYIYKYGITALDFFGRNEVFNFKDISKKIDYEICHVHFESSKLTIQADSTDIANGTSSGYFNFGGRKTHKENQEIARDLTFNSKERLDEIEQFQLNFSRIFIQNQKLRKQNVFSDSSLNIDASNLENVLKRILENERTKSELINWLQIFVPEFEKIEIYISTLSGKSELAVFEKTLLQPLTKNLISDGTYNILSLLTAVFQFEEPQFLCIEEPENGLHPFVIKELVKFLRTQCEEKGHYIWLNTHSQTLVSQLNPEEIITVWKEDGATKIKQHQGEDLYNLTMDEAWLSNALGGGVPW